MKVDRYKGMRDFPPQEMILRNFVLDTIRQTFESFGFDPLETPAIENWNVLSSKGGGGSEILKETYQFKDKGNREVGLRYDLTVPLARFMAMNPTLPLPFKRYQIGRVWRYSDIAKGRFREFWQADVDVIGSEDMLADAEVIACANSALKNLGFKKFTIRLNNRKILSALVKYAGVEERKTGEVFKIIDKLEKIGSKGVEEELSQLGLPDGIIKKVMKFVKIEGSPREILGKASKLVGDVEEGLKETQQLLSYLKTLKIDSELKIDFSLARGLDYYTGPIFEIVASEDVGSIAGGGRYDEMVSVFLGKDIPATGISLGVERIIEVMKEREIVKLTKTKVKVLVANVNEEVIEDSLKIAQQLRGEGIATLMDLRKRKLTKQLAIANSLGIPYVVVVGPQELKEGKVTLRDMETGEQKKVKVDKIKEELA